MATHTPNPMSDEQAVLSTVKSFLACIVNRDKALMHALALPNGGATLIRNGEALHMNLAALVDRIPFDSPKKIDERTVGDPEIRVDVNIAMAWVPYEVLIDEKVDHIGTNILSLAKIDGKWLISGVADNSRSP